ncbi:hypothetical protein ACTJJ0_33390 [Chitinophaga sp. 22321]|uniref:DUF3863 domain-containing protein n=1 Tax=Chitinophaga hostae TaxID=2831022 RepID=A0ABS5JBK7_9BACT|nr:hypothetical protein [Chitinophaga hostae]MBS0031982.1 hypothetical protein [Chitinophaga hostae]
MLSFTQRPAAMLLAALAFYGSNARAQKLTFNEKGISRPVLENYLNHAVTMTEFLAVDPYASDAPYPHKEDDIRLIHHLGAKFIGRAIYRWGGESVLTNKDYLDNARRLVKEVQQNDPEVIFQAALFEQISEQVNTIPIPGWAFKALSLPVENRHFRYQEMLNLKGKLVDHWSKGNSVPDITRQETQLWFMFLAGTYMEMGCEALHLGQIALIGMEDPALTGWSTFLVKLRAYAKDHTRHHWVLLDAHTPSGGMVVNGKSLLDFNSFPLRIKSVPEHPQQGILQMGFTDALFGRSHGGIAPSGWKAASMPYLVELDNFGISNHPGVPDTTTIYPWGFDEISWFYQQPEQYRNNWLRYAHAWIASHDTNGHLQMPVTRVVTLGRKMPRLKFRANTRSENCPDGMNTENTIKEIWQEANVKQR